MSPLRHLLPTSRNAIASLVRDARRAGHKVITREAANHACLYGNAGRIAYLCAGFYVLRA